MTNTAKKKVGPRRQYILTRDQFESIRVFLAARGWTAERQQIAEMYLVDAYGYTLKEVAEQYGVSHQSVADCAKRAWNIYQQFIATDDERGYVRVVTTAPAAMAEEFQKKVAVAKWADEWKERESGEAGKKSRR